jgi:hypothetical protein
MNSIPVIGWLLSVIFTTSTALPFWIAWTNCGIGERYFYFLPEVYHDVPFWDCVGVFLVVGIIKGVFVPKIASVSQTNNQKGGKGENSNS